MLPARLFIPGALASGPCAAVPLDAVQNAMADIDTLTQRIGPGALELLTMVAAVAGFRMLRRMMGPVPSRRPVVGRAGRMRPGVWGYQLRRAA